MQHRHLLAKHIIACAFMASGLWACPSGQTIIEDPADLRLHQEGSDQVKIPPGWVAERVADGSLAVRSPRGDVVIHVAAVKAGKVRGKIKRSNVGRFHREALAKLGVGTVTTLPEVNMNTGRIYCAKGINHAGNLVALCLRADSKLIKTGWMMMVVSQSRPEDWSNFKGHALLVEILKSASGFATQ